LLAQYLTVLCLLLGGWYIAWRWTHSLNFHALWFSVPVALAESGAFIGLILFSINLWAVRDLPLVAPPERIGACVDDSRQADRPITVDIFITTYNEDPELVRLGVCDAKRLRYPHPIDIRIHVLDDGGRDPMRDVARQEGVAYLRRDDNVGFKAGNLRNAMEQTSGDFLVICDADTRLFPTFLEHTLGYFRDPKMAWVQTPQWFYDLPEGQPLVEILKRDFGAVGRFAARRLEGALGSIAVGADPFCNDPQMFYDVILRRRNWANAAFCCGAGSIHRREAVMQTALRTYAAAVERSSAHALQSWARKSRVKTPSPERRAAIRAEKIVTQVFAPYKFHVSEDIYTSILMHSDYVGGWKSYLHPTVESKMLSPQDLMTWTIQRFKYAGGTLDIFFYDNPLFRRGLTIAQRAMYASTFWSYLGGVWTTVFLISPIIYLFTGIAPVQAYTSEFIERLLPFLVVMELSSMVSTWGVASTRSKASYISFFAVNLQALWTVVRGKTIQFPVTPKERQAGRHLVLVAPQIGVIALSLVSLIYGVSAMGLGFGDYSVTGLLCNIFWSVSNIISLSTVVRAAFWRPEGERARLPSVRWAARARALAAHLAGASAQLFTTARGHS
jgi:cellulose synthase (UDP-forming)